MTMKAKRLRFCIKVLANFVDRQMPVPFILMVTPFVLHAYLKRRGKQGRTIRVLMVPLDLTSSAVKELYRSLRSKDGTSRGQSAD
ncbi:hypothetical protein [Pseudomonas phage Pf17397_F_PD1]|nr:hypothetical protein [Pseudomonas phage Pf17397_F_PD1]